MGNSNLDGLPLTLRYSANITKLQHHNIFQPTFVGTPSLTFRKNNYLQSFSLTAKDTAKTSVIKISKNFA